MLGAACSPDPQRASIVIVSVDTLRSDHVGLYGGRLKTANLDRIGREGATVTNAFAPCGRTTQSVGSMLTGLHPFTHGADGLGMKLPEEAVTIAEHLAGLGFETVAFTSNLNLAPNLGFEQGFDVYSNPRSRFTGNSADQITDEALAWLSSRDDPDRPFLLWVHYLDPHWTYEPPDDLAALVDPDWNGEFDLYERWQSGTVEK